MTPNSPAAVDALLDAYAARGTTIQLVRSVEQEWARKALPHSEAHRMLGDLRTALDGTEQPTTDTTNEA
ncbi:hypothetical protein [Streptomyces cylindrosporus]|uniref:Uncharacterized protein n=1 Tax=Streptomyces cylindrosporus TaxID=2927583 RepID=A0ABS9YK23_9ACTN|nr:hypothetical protein [Streptomyces cylindrosporus]MCI3277597.1 hypothetical protein [Streptomyces cylindrosporus]